MVAVTREKDMLRCSFSGRLDTLHCATLENEVLGGIDGDLAGVVFDLKDVDYIASCFLRICIQAAQKVGGEKFSIVNVQPQVKKVLKLSAFDKMFTIK